MGRARALPLLRERRCELKRRKLADLLAERRAAPALVVPFAPGGNPYLVPADRVAEVPSGIITLSPLGVFLVEVWLAWERMGAQ